MSCPRVPPRLHFYLARAAPVGLLLRRGPTEWVRLIGWNTEDDTFEPGAWFRGRIYAEKCDLSPDGRLFVYFAAKFGRGGWAEPDAFYREVLEQAAASVRRRGSRVEVAGPPEGAAAAVMDDGYGEAWTAVSRPPWLYAHALWPQGTTYNGGGSFLGNDQLLLHAGYLLPKAHPQHRPPRALRIETSPDLPTDFRSVLRRRLTASGWRFSPHPGGLVARALNTAFAGTPGPFPAVKPHPQARYALELHDNPQELFPQSARFFLRCDPDEPEPLQVEWADWDHRGRLVYTAEGRLWAREVRNGALQPPRELYDFRDMQPDPVPPPEWATRWG
ncbi:MAG: hypothetical protein ACK47B_18715 [Armatimonadota bacterium]